jgi:hypothetical protein
MRANRPSRVSAESEARRRQPLPVVAPRLLGQVGEFFVFFQCGLFWFVPEIAALFAGSPATFIVVIVVVKGRPATVSALFRFIIIGEQEGLSDFLVTQHACLLKRF